MKIEPREILIGALTQGYVEDAEKGVRGYYGNLNIRPAYQREFVYKDKQRDAVIDTIRKGFPLNVMYWVYNEDETYEVLDGQQRTISICQYVHGDFSINDQYFHNLEEDQQQQILNYKLMVYVCEGDASEKLEWFKIINIAGEKLFAQELRNAIYTGPWLAHAKRHFSKTGCPAYKIGNKLLTGSPIRQDYLETAIKWINNKKIEAYMADHQHDANANELWLYFQKVIGWVNATFPIPRKEMKGIDWGLLYNDHHERFLDPAELEGQIKELMIDDEVQKPKGIYTYLLTGDEKHLGLRTFTEKQKRVAFEKQNGICPITGKQFEDYNKMHADHIVPWSKGGKTTDDNCQMLDPKANLEKSNK